MGKVKTLLERGQWCLALFSAENIHEEGIADTAEMLTDGIKAYSQMTEVEVLEELTARLTDGEPNLIPYTLGELVKQAEERLGIN